MKILEICTSKSLGGLELYFLKCCEKLTSYGDVEVQVFVQEQTPIHENLPEMIRSQLIDGRSLMRRIRRLNQIIKTFQPDIIHSHVKTDLLSIALCKVICRKKFKHVHSRQMNMPRKKKDLYHRFIYGKIDLLITITSRLKEQVLENVDINAEKVRVLYYGVPEVTGSPDQTLNIDLDKNFKIGLIARLDAKKNQHILVEALGILNNKRLTVSAYLIGKSTDVKYEAKLRGQISEFGLENQIHFSGFIKNPIRLMPIFDVILLTSADETFGLVLIEAMRAGVAVVGANGGGVPEIIEHEKTGLLFRPNDAQSLSHELEKVIQDKDLLHKLARAGKKSADEKFNEEKHFDTLHQIFQKVILS